ncbi:helix-turn-helix domain-containing protein [Streptomyces sp. NPDC048527]|uniref:helix-turn-helix domain-containing protein n=1 Tax=Streptomyces sp. NPDC048527 TaxID=3365568 RepID=UPI003711BD1E
MVTAARGRDRTVSSSQGTLAEMLGLRRPTLNRVLKYFERDGLLRVGYRQVELPVPDRPQHRAR